MADFRDDGQSFHNVRSALMGIWDPFGVNGIPGAATEYDQQVLVITEMLETGKSGEEMAAYLRRAEHELTGEEPDPVICDKAASALMALRPA